MLKEPTVFEKTLSISQLFTLNNPLWTVGLTIETIHDILGYYGNAKIDGLTDHFGDFLDSLIANNYEDDWAIYQNYKQQFEAEK